MVVDNVVVILMFAPVAIPIARHLGLPLAPLVLMIGFSANFMGSAMLLGDLPPQMMHSVSARSSSTSSGTRASPARSRSSSSPSR